MLFKKISEIADVIIVDIIVDDIHVIRIQINIVIHFCGLKNIKFLLFLFIGYLSKK